MYCVNLVFNKMRSEKCERNKWQKEQMHTAIHYDRLRGYYRKILFWKHSDPTPTPGRLNEDTMKRAKALTLTSTHHIRSSTPSSFQNLARSKALDPPHTSQPPTHPQCTQLSWDISPSSERTFLFLPHPPSSLFHGSTQRDPFAETMM